MLWVTSRVERQGNRLQLAGEGKVGFLPCPQSLGWGESEEGLTVQRGLAGQ